jgi:beta-glucosidase
MLKRTLGVIMTLTTLSQAADPARTSSPQDIEKRAEAILAKLTIEEKVDLLGGVNGFYIRGIDRLQLPSFKMADGPLGVRNFGPSTAYAAGIALAAAWDVDLANRVGMLIGRDARARGVHFLLGPGVNIHRSPLCGRNFEYFGEDPFLASRMTVAYINGVQSQGVSATVKHFLGNNSEFDRHGTSSDIDERTLREIYLPTFEAAVKEAHVGAIMNSYNLVNGVHMTQNAPLNVDLVKKEWGFDGVLMSDWDATYDGVAAANAGLDVEMPSGRFMNRETLLPAIRDHKVTVATVDDKVRRILRTAIRFGWLDRNQTDLTWSLVAEEGRKVALQSAQASLVLLKNQDHLLPIDKTSLRTVFVVGPAAYPALPAGGGSARVQPFAAVSILQAMSDALVGQAQVLYRPGIISPNEVFDSSEFVTEPGPNGKPGLVGEYFANFDLKGAPSVTRIDQRVHFSWDRGNSSPVAPAKEYSVRWKGYFMPAHTGDHRFVASTYGLDLYRLYVDNKLVLDRGHERQPMLAKTLHLEAGKAVPITLEYSHRDHHAQIGFGVRRADQFLDPDVATLAARADLVLVAAGFDSLTESEGFDRTFQLPMDQDELIRTVQHANKKTIVSITSGGAVDMHGWLEHTRALFQTWYPGQEGGTALVQAIFGEVNPSGKLPVSLEQRWEENAVFQNYFPDHQKHIAYREGVWLGYRHFDRGPHKVLFPFGFGLSYSEFKYANLFISPVATSADRPVTITFDVTNKSARAGAEVAQIYVGQIHPKVQRPVKELKGFAKVHLEPGETKHVSVELNQRSFAYYDPGSRSWRADPDEYVVSVGSSSQKIELQARVRVE